MTVTNKKSVGTSPAMNEIRCEIKKTRVCCVHTVTVKNEADAARRRRSRNASATSKKNYIINTLLFYFT